MKQGPLRCPICNESPIIEYEPFAESWLAYCENCYRHPSDDYRGGSGWLAGLDPIDGSSQESAASAWNDLAVRASQP